MESKGNSHSVPMPCNFLNGYVGSYEATLRPNLAHANWGIDWGITWLTMASLSSGHVHL